MTVSEWQNKQMRNPEYRREYDALEQEFSFIGSLIRARARAGLTQEQVAQRMEPTRAAIVRMEGGVIPSTRALRKFAEATGGRLRITFEPERARKQATPKS